MEPLTGLALTCGVLQIVDFSIQTIKIYRQLRSSPTSDENAAHVALATHLDVLSRNITVSLQRVEQQTPGRLSPEDLAFWPVAQSCSELAKTVLSRVQRCGLLPSGRESGPPATRSRRALAALKTRWKKREIDDIDSKLNGFRCQILLQIASANQKKLDDISAQISESKKTWSPEMHQLHQDVLAKLSSIERSVEERRDGSIGMRRFLSPLSASGTSVELNTGTFTALHTHHDDDNGPDNLPNALHNAFRPPFENYQEAFFRQVRKEVRGAAKAELEAIKVFLGQALAELHSQTEQAAPPARRPSEPRLSELKPEEFDMSLIPNPYARGTTIGDIDCVETYSKAWVKSCPIGSISFDITRRQHFLPGLMPIRTTVSRLVFTPMASWMTTTLGISTGVILQYESRQDNGGWPSFFPSLQVFRVLPRDDKVWGLLKLGEIEPIRAMFAQGILHPLDRNSYGRTLLHHAANYDHLELCKFLVQVGCRTTEADMDGMLPEDLALLPKRFRLRSGLHQTFRYLVGKRQESRAYLPPEQKNDEVMVARICRTAMMARDPWFIRPWVLHCTAMDVDLTRLPLLLLNLCLRRESRSVFVWHPFLQDIEEKWWWSRKIARGLFRTLCETELPSNPMYGEASLMHLVASSLVDLFQTNLNINSCSSFRSLHARLPRRARTDYKTLSWISASILKNGGDMYTRDGDGESVTDYFQSFGLLAVWEDILVDSGFVPLLVFEEDKRRREGNSAAATTHDFKFNSRDAHSFMGMRRRSISVM
ncbi:hypothetical protein B0T14DRAFT_245295 [Immersiella caudata]|uniref:Uncharacterized protein n=1 Tax=Immersiella caudata TaxID=314043 RepID=A0AA39WJ41_9PEZI|nr:hypothetical protein B0T14DRAFT_245295 [Immersiella caudata]